MHHTDQETQHTTGTISKQSVNQAIPDHLLRQFATPNPAWDRGEISDQDRAMLVVAVPDIAAELLAYRQAERLAKAIPGARAPWFARLLPFHIMRAAK
jgi:hypothetical protein